MKVLLHWFKPALLTGIVVIVVLGFSAAAVNAQAQARSSYFYAMRQIVTPPFGARNPIGLAYFAVAKKFVVLNTLSSGQTNDALALVPFYPNAGTGTAKALPAAEPMNFTYSPRDNQYWQYSG